MTHDPTTAIPIQLSPNLTLQTPLSRLGRGPGLILLADENAPLGFSNKTLDPPPLQKWAEEGFAVVQLLVTDGLTEGINDAEPKFNEAVEALRWCRECEFGSGIGVVCMWVFIFILRLE